MRRAHNSNPHCGARGMWDESRKVGNAACAVASCLSKSSAETKIHVPTFHTHSLFGAFYSIKRGATPTPCTPNVKQTPTRLHILTGKVKYLTWNSGCQASSKSSSPEQAETVNHRDQMWYLQPERALVFTLQKNSSLLARTRGEIHTFHSKRE